MTVLKSLAGNVRIADEEVSVFTSSSEDGDENAAVGLRPYSFEPLRECNNNGSDTNSDSDDEPIEEQRLLDLQWYKMDRRAFIYCMFYYVFYGFESCNCSVLWYVGSFVGAHVVLVRLCQLRRSASAAGSMMSTWLK